MIWSLKAWMMLNRRQGIIYLAKDSQDESGMNFTRYLQTITQKMADQGRSDIYVVLPGSFVVVAFVFCKLQK